MTDHCAIEQCQKLLASELDSLNQLIEQSTKSKVVLINQIAHYIIDSGGKRIRPLLLLLIYQMLANEKSNRLDDAILMAAVVEFIHTSTLLHDDVVDQSETRRNQKTANNLWGNAASVLVGDFLYSRSFQMMLEVKSTTILKVLANTTNSIAEGEVLQLLETQNSGLSLEAYYQIINRKTASLFQSSAEIAARLAAIDESEIESVKAVGQHLGVLFQLMDDSLDYFGDETEIGKKLGDDWAERKVTLPLIYAFESERKEWFLEKFNPELLKNQSKVLDAKKDLNAIIIELKKLKIDQRCFETGNLHKNKAIEQLKHLEAKGYQNQFSQGLKQLIIFLSERKS